MRTTMLTFLAGATWVGLGLAQPAQAMPMAPGINPTAVDAATTLMAEPVQYYGPRRYHGPYYRHYRPAPRYGYGPRHYHRRNDGLAAGLAAGAIGALAIGGLAASGAFDQPAVAAPMAPARRQWCADRYRSYNPADGTFVGNDGRRRFCG